MVNVVLRPRQIDWLTDQRISKRPGLRWSTSFWGLGIRLIDCLIDQRISKRPGLRWSTSFWGLGIRLIDWLIDHRISKRPGLRGSTSFWGRGIRGSKTEFRFVFSELLYVHRDCTDLGTGSPGQPPRLSHSSWALVKQSSKLLYVHRDHKDY